MISQIPKEKKSNKQKRIRKIVDLKSKGFNYKQRDFFFN